ncbi:MAG: hypothetical protein HY588_03770 [Candidatus Omnitrophica bacterium]|nr:hypothetical protein [Candidatus Omnitrophota bacterium]
MKYRCMHCNHTFDLGERDFRRCPNCFWTTSLTPMGGESEAEPVPQKSKSAVKFNGKVLAFALGSIFVAGIIFFLLKNWESAPVFKTDRKTADVEPPLPVASLLSEAEQNELVNPLQMTIPRQLTEDEEEILKKQVSFPASFSPQTSFTVWKKEDFEKMLVTEQKKRKITFGWLYLRSLTKTFEKYYPEAAQAYQKEDYLLARELFLGSLSFPVYQNDPKVHRAVVLVMLRSYLNDVLGKLAVINQHLLSQELSTDVRSIFESYQALFPVLELQEWDRSLALIHRLQNQIAEFENKPQAAETGYPSVFGELDLEIQNAIRAEAAPKPEAAVSLKALSIDLNLKEKAVRQNTPEVLLKVQKQAEEISQALEAKEWSVARQGLELIDFPPELLRQARRKLGLLDQAAAIREAQAK